MKLKEIKIHEAVGTLTMDIILEILLEPQALVKKLRERYKNENRI